MKRLILLIISLSVLWTVPAAERVLFRHLTMKDGLSDNQVNDIMRDSKGFVWISTAHGLCRYDGYEFKVFLRDNDNLSGIPYNHVESVREDAAGMLWLSFGHGRYACYNPVKEHFSDAGTVLGRIYGLEGNPVLVFVDADKNIWAECENGTLYHLDVRAGKAHVVDYSMRKNGQLTDICDSPGGIAAVFSDGSFVFVDKNSYSVDAMARVPDAIGGNNAGYRIFCDMDGDYWIWKENSAWLYQPHFKHWTHLTGSSPVITGRNVKSAVVDRHGHVWVAIENGGIDIIDKKTLAAEHVRNNISDARSLSDNSVQCLFADNDGGMWIGTFKHGVSYYNENRFRFRFDNFHEFHSVRDFNPDVIAMTEDRNGNLWFATPSGLIRTDRVTKKKELIALPEAGDKERSSTTIISMEASKNGNIWIATYDHGLMMYDGKSFSHKVLDPHDANSVVNKTVWSVAEDKSGYLWIGTWGAGLYGLDPDSGRIRSYRDSDGIFGRSQIASICVSGDNNIYLGTTYGVDVYNPMSGSFSKLLGNKAGDSQFSSHLIVQLYEDSRGLLWICTREGLNVFDRRNDEVILPVEELKHTVIHGVTEDDDKNMWVTTPDGLYHIIVSHNPHTRDYMFSYQAYNTLNAFEDFGFNQQSLLTHSSGAIVSGGISGVSLVHPSEFGYAASLPDVQFTGLQLFNRDIVIDSVYDGVVIADKSPAFADEIRLNYDQNVFSVEFSAMDYVSRESISYMYMLDGFDSDWMRSASNKLTYTNLAPGKYTLKVKAVNSDGYESNKAAELSIVINPPFWYTWKAYVLYLLVFVGIIALIRRYLKRNEIQKYELLKIQQEARQKHDLDDMKLRFFTNISHDLRTPLTLILTPLEYVMAHTENPDLREKLGVARNNAMRLLGMVNQLLDFRKSDMNVHNFNPSCGNIVDTIRNICDTFIEYSEHRNISLTFFSSVQSLYMMYDQDKITKTMMNLLSNAFKFTPEGGRVDVSLEVVAATEKQEMLEIKVADNGCGIDDKHKKLIFDRFYQVPQSNCAQSTGNGIGLNLVKEFVALHNGSVSVCDNVGKGAVFIVSIPVVHPQGAVAAENTDKNGVNDSPEEYIDEPNDIKTGEKRPTILIVDDNDDFRKFMRDCLKENYDVREAYDGAKAWDIIPDLQPDVIVSDVMMPEMDGNELCRRVKTDIRTSHIPIILLTARTAKEHELKGLESGADDYITKPFNLSIITHRLKNILAARQDVRRKAMDISPSRINITPLDEKLMKKAMRYVEENMERSDLSVEELSGELGMSRVHLYKKLVAITGKTPVEFIRILRLKRAAQLLAESQLNIAEVTYRTGFNNLSLFRKYFKNEFGVLPSEYQSRYGKTYNESL